MKPNILMKFAVVFMAAFGAYAFSGNTNNQFSYKENKICTEVNVACSDDGNYTCRVKLNSNSIVVDVWDLECTKLVKHTTPDIINEM